MTLPIIHHPTYTIPLPQLHRFPLEKYAALINLLKEKRLALPTNIYEPKIAPKEWLELAHDTKYVSGICELNVTDDIIRRIGLPLSRELVERSRFSTGGSILAGQLALSHRIACQTAGGSHHAKSATGAGYCVFNDVAIACRVLQKLGLVKYILIVDLDVHQGDGTAEIFTNDETVTTFSMHCEKNFPLRKENSDLDVDLPVGTGDFVYNEILAYQLEYLLDKRNFDLVFYNAGVDPHNDDRLGKLALTNAGLLLREEIVIGTCLARGLPLACVVGGGYGPPDALANRHSILHSTANRLLYAK